MINKWQFSCLLIITILVSGCSREHEYPDLEKYVSDLTKRPQPVVENLPVYKPYNPYIYDVYDKRSPFSPHMEVSLDGSPNAHRPLQDLEMYPLNTLTMVGVLADHKVIWALIQTPTGGIYKVAVGNYMGRNYGRIIAVGKNYIKVEESIFNQENGRWANQTTTLSMQTTDAQGKKTQ